MPFENDVKTYGTQAAPVQDVPKVVFENDVKTYGTQACTASCVPFPSLRMM